ncbi:MAG: hypothetical protein F9K22_05815 [Bacteroidetes bacterium]|nr:MAG: hypothetical protein F9K22_05815 [Bacteroidota bacterium]
MPFAALSTLPWARIVARALSASLFILWGAFFVEHLTWFSTLLKNPPPAWVWFLSLMHFLLLVSYLVSMKWEKAGSVLMVVSAVTFFSFAAGINAVPFILVSILPVAAYSICWFRERTKTTPV